MQRCRRSAAITRQGGVVGGWLGAIALNLIANRDFDIAVRDVVMGIGAITLARRLHRAAREARERRERRTPEQIRRTTADDAGYSAGL